MSVKKSLNSKLKIIKETFEIIKKMKKDDSPDDILARVDTIRNLIFHILDSSVSDFPNFKPRRSGHVHFPLIKFNEADSVFESNCESRAQAEKTPELMSFLQECLKIIRRNRNALFFLNTSSKHTSKIDEVLYNVQSKFSALEYKTNDPNFLLINEKTKAIRIGQFFEVQAGTPNVTFTGGTFISPTGITKVGKIVIDDDSQHVIKLKKGGEIHEKTLVEWLQNLIDTLEQMLAIYPE